MQNWKKKKKKPRNVLKPIKFDVAPAMRRCRAEFSHLIYIGEKHLALGHAGCTRENICLACAEVLLTDAIARLQVMKDDLYSKTTFNDQ